MYFGDKKKSYSVIIGIICIWLLFVYYESYIRPIQNGWSNFIVLCADFWQYLTEAQKYSKNGVYLKEIIEVGKEPLLFVITSTLERLSGLKSEISLVIVSILAQILTVLAIYVWIYRTTKRRLTAILGLTLVSTAYLNNVSLVYLISRQILANSLLIIFFVFSLYVFHKNRTWYLVMSILVAAISMSHRMWILFIGIYFIYIFIKSLIHTDFEKIKKNLTIIGLSLIISWPYNFLQIGDILLSIQWYLWKNPEQSFISGLETFQANISTAGWSFLINGNTTDIPLVHYLKNQWLYLLIFFSSISAFKKLLKNKGVEEIVSIFLIILIYTSFNLIFWVRILTTLEIFLILILCLTVHNKVWKNILRLTPLIAIYGIVFISQNIINKPRTIEINNDPSIVFIQKTIDREASFFIGSYCVSDLASQLNYQNANTLAYAPLANRSVIPKDTTSINLHYYAVLEMSKILMDSIGQKPYIHEMLKDKDLYILFWYGTPDATMKQLYNKTHPYFKSPYLELIYSHKNYQGYMRYIFKVKTQHMQYFDTLNYLKKNLK